MNVEKIIEKYLPAEEGLQKSLIEAMNYSVLAGGKRIRPVLMQEVYQMLGGKEEVIEPFMAAMEMIHTYSLVHDDLPAMDNDLLRRGRTTTWAEYGEDMGILAGDGLLTYAFETAAKGFALTAYPERAAKAIGILASKAGISGMAGGQAVDVELTGSAMSAEVLDFIYRLKTGALLEASMMIGAVLAGADEAVVKKAESIAAAAGMAFQIRDDILDVIAGEEELGKPIGSDDRNEKTTYVTLYGLEKAQEKVSELTSKALTELDTMPGSSDYLKNFIKSMENRMK